MPVVAKASFSPTTTPCFPLKFVQVELQRQQHPTKGKYYTQVWNVELVGGSNITMVTEEDPQSLLRTLNCTTDPILFGQLGSKYVLVEDRGEDYNTCYISNMHILTDSSTLNCRFWLTFSEKAMAKLVDVLEEAVNNWLRKKEMKKKAREEDAKKHAKGEAEEEKESRKRKSAPQSLHPNTRAQKALKVLRELANSKEAKEAVKHLEKLY